MLGLSTLTFADGPPHFSVTAKSSNLGVFGTSLVCAAEDSGTNKKKPIAVVYLILLLLPGGGFGLIEGVVGRAD